MDDCIFCKIVKGEIPSKKIHESDNFIIVPDIKPSAKMHFLLICKNHIQDLSLAPDNLLIEAKNVVFELQKKLNLDEFQFRVNWGKLLEVNHLHFHFLAGFNN